MRFIAGTLFFCAVGVVTALAMWIIGSAIKATQLSEEWWLVMGGNFVALALGIWFAISCVGFIGRLSRNRGRAPVK